MLALNFRTYFTRAGTYVCTYEKSWFRIL